MIARGDQKLAVGIDARTRGFDADAVLDAIARLRTNPGLRIQLVYAWADESTLLRRYTETRRRHPLAPQGVVADGIAAEIALTEPLREHADLVVDTSGLPIANLRRADRAAFRRRRRPGTAGGVADFLRLPQGPAAGSRSGIRRTLPTEPALRPHIASQDRNGPRCRRLRRGRPGFRKIFFRARRTSSNWSCRGSCKRERDTRRSQSGVRAAGTDPFI